MLLFSPMPCPLFKLSMMGSLVVSSVTLSRIFGKSLMFLAGAPFIIWKGKAIELPMNLQKLLGSLISHRLGKGLFQVLLIILLLRNSVSNAFAFSLLYFNFSSLKFTCFLSKKKKNIFSSKPNAVLTKLKFV